MAVSALGISGRLEEGEVLQAWVLGTVTGLQWQALVNGSWVDVGTAGSQTYTIPAGAAGTAYRLTGATAEGLVYSTTTGAAVLDTHKARAPVLSGPAYSMLDTEQAAPGSVFNWLALSDADKGNYAGGSLLVQDSMSLLHGGDGQDVLGVRFGGTAAGQFSYNAATHEIRYAFTSGSPVTVGTMDTALDGKGTDLKVVFNSNATAAVVDALIDNLQFSNGDDSPTASRLLTLRVTDPTGGSAQRVTSVDIQNTPDAPVFTSAANFAADENQIVAGTVAALDPDREAGQPQGISYALAAGQGDADNARFTMDAATGTLLFNAAPDYEDTTHAPLYSVRVRATDSDGSITEQVMTVTVRDVNDAPVASGITAFARENGPAISIDAVFADQDAGDTHTITFDASGTIGNVTLSGGTFTYDTAGRFEQLPSYSIASDSFTYTVTDAAGASSTRTVTVQVQGENDPASISGTATASLQEDAGVDFGGVIHAGGQLVVADVDQGQAAVMPPGSGNAGLGSFVVSTGGQWWYQVSNSRLQALGAGETAVDSVGVTSWDGTASTQLSVTIAGVNDAPILVIVQGSDGGEVVEAGAAGSGTAQASGTLNAVDPDAHDTLTWSGGADGGYGRFDIDSAGHWRYAPDDLAPATQSLAQGATVQEHFTATVTDSQGATAQQQVTITVTGSNDAPVIVPGSDLTGAVAESPVGHLLIAMPAGESDHDIAVDAAGRIVLLDQTYDGMTLSRHNADGSADLSFGNGGGVAVDAGSSAVAIDAAGRILVAGQVHGTGGVGVNPDYSLARYLADGTLDTTFGSGGLASVDVAGSYDYAEKVMSGVGGNILLSGRAIDVPGSGNFNLTVVSLNQDGSVDASFGANGRWTFTLEGQTTQDYQVVQDGAGRLLVWGLESDPASGLQEVHVYRYLQDGSVDSAFAGGGHAIVACEAATVDAVQLAASSDGGLVLAWSQSDGTGQSISLARLGASGTQDSAFGSGGILHTGFEPMMGEFAIAIDAQDRIVLGASLGRSDSGAADAVAARYHLDGTADTAFGQDGIAATGFGTYASSAGHAFLGADGSVLLAGHDSGSGYSSTVALARFTPDGTPDAAFGAPLPDQQAWGWINGSDPDTGSVLSWSGNADGTYGQFVVEGSSWKYQLDNARPATQALGAGETATDTFVMTATDEWGASVSQQVVITIVGSYDPPAP